MKRMDAKRLSKVFEYFDKKTKKKQLQLSGLKESGGENNLKKINIAVEAITKDNGFRNKVNLLRGLEENVMKKIGGKRDEIQIENNEEILPE